MNSGFLRASSQEFHADSIDPGFFGCCLGLRRVQLVARQRALDADRGGHEQQLGIGLSWQHRIEQQFRKRRIQQQLGFHWGGLGIKWQLRGE